MMAFSSDILQTTGPTKAQGFYLSYDRDSLPMTVVVVVEFVSSSLSLLKNKIGSSCYTHHQREKFHAWQQQNETEKTFATIPIHSFELFFLFFNTLVINCQKVREKKRRRDAFLMYTQRQ